MTINSSGGGGRDVAVNSERTDAGMRDWLFRTHVHVSCVCHDVCALYATDIWLLFCSASALLADVFCPREISVRELVNGCVCSVEGSVEEYALKPEERERERERSKKEREGE